MSSGTCGPGDDHGAGAAIQRSWRLKIRPTHFPVPSSRHSPGPTAGNGRASRHTRAVTAGAWGPRTHQGDIMRNSCMTPPSWPAVCALLALGPPPPRRSSGLKAPSQRPVRGANEAEKKAGVLSPTSAGAPVCPAAQQTTGRGRLGGAHAGGGGPCWPASAADAYRQAAWQGGHAVRTLHQGSGCL